MGAWCDIPLKTTNVVNYDNTVIRSVLVECTIEFGRQTGKPLGVGAEQNFLAIWEKTVGIALQNGATWSPVNRAWVLHFLGKVGKEAARLTTSFGESHVTGQRVNQAASIVIEHARKVEARISA
jgi:hypothetical protein